MSDRCALITGCNGGIGQALCSAFRKAGWYVVGSDCDTAKDTLSCAHVVVDLAQLCQDVDYRDDRLAALRAALPTTGLSVLINNAALQIVAPVETLTCEDWHATLNVNLIAPFILIQALLPKLAQANGSVINIASIHAKLTKPQFSAYATSKSALLGMTRALAVELGGRVRVNAISPAAIATKMLEEGFAGNQQLLNKLASFHPSGCIGATDDVIRAAMYLIQSPGQFLNGMILDLDGGIGSRLHDPE